MSTVQVDTINESTTGSGVTIDGVLVKDGAIASSYISGLSGGKVLQVVQGTYATATAIASTTYTDTGLTASITPSATTSKILVALQHNARPIRSANSTDFYVQLLRDATSIREIINFVEDTATTSYKQMSLSPVILCLDSPSTTSSITYKTQGKISTTANGQSVTFSYNNYTDTIILIEIDGT